MTSHFTFTATGPSEQKPNKKNLEKRERGRIQGLSKFLEYPLLSQEWVKLRTSNFVRTFTVIDGNKSPLKISVKVAVGVLRDSYRTHRAVIFAIAQLSCSFSAFRGQAVGPEVGPERKWYRV